MIKLGDLVCLKCHKSFFDPRKRYLAESYGTGHIPVGVVTDVSRSDLTDPDSEAYSARVLWQKKSAGGYGPSTIQKIHAITKL